MNIVGKFLIQQPKLAAQLFRPVRLINRQVKWIEDMIETPITHEDLASVRKGCDLSGVRLGEYYHWYLQKRLVSDTIRNLSREEGMSLVESVDATNYADAAEMFDTKKGVLIALPHHAHYIFSVVSIAEKLRETRPVLLFFGEPGRNPGNEIFDHMCRVFYGPGRNVDTVHDTRQGLAKTMRALKEGAAVFILPDAFLNEEATLAIPFCGSALNIMLGTAILARKTGALIQPVLSTPHGKGFGFKTEFAPTIVHAPGVGESGIETRIRDYEVMRRIFGFYEQTMSSEIVYWQQMRRHLSQQGVFRNLSAGQLEKVATMLAEDPVLTGPELVVDLRAVA